MADEVQNATATPALSDSILVTVRRACDLEDDYKHFDPEILVSINSYLQVLWMQGVGTSGFKVTSETQTWSDFLGENENHLLMAVGYLCKKVKLAFDPPQNSTLYNAQKEQTDELLWYIGVESDILEGYEEVDSDEED